MDTANTNRDMAIKKIVNMPAEQMLKVLIFMQEMETGEAAKNTGLPQTAESG